VSTFVYLNLSGVHLFFLVLMILEYLFKGSMTIGEKATEGDKNGGHVSVIFFKKVYLVE